MNNNYSPVCGLDCSVCEFLGKNCEGCGNVQGRPFWTSRIPSGICPIYDCCINKKHEEHCGLCRDFPCNIFLELRDPGMSDDEFRESLAERKDTLKKRVGAGT